MLTNEQRLALVFKGAKNKRLGITQAQREQIAVAYLYGDSLSALAKEYSASVSTIRYHIRQASKGK